MVLSRQADFAFRFVGVPEDVALIDFLNKHMPAEQNVFDTRMANEAIRYITDGSKQNRSPYSFLHTLERPKTHGRTMEAWRILVTIALLYPNQLPKVKAVILPKVSRKERKTWAITLSKLVRLGSELQAARTQSTMLQAATRVIRTAHKPILKFEPNRQWATVAREKGLKAIWVPSVSIQT